MRTSQRALVLAVFLSLFAAGIPLQAKPAPRPEIGKVSWKRDFDGALAASAKSGKPLFVLFQEVPGCEGCRNFGTTVLSEPLMIEAIESLFEPVLVYNNQGGRDAELLKRFKEPAWNYQVVRFLDAKARDIIPRRDKVWTTPALAKRMIETLEKSKRPVPNYLHALAGEAAAANRGTAAFAMFCFWTGEQKLGGLEGVLTTEAGWHDGREVTLVTFDRDRIPFPELLKKAASFDCARKVYTTSSADAKVAARSKLAHGPLGSGYRPAKLSDQKKQLTGTAYAKLSLLPVQATKVNAHARTRPAEALAWLSPRQKQTLTKR